MRPAGLILCLALLLAGPLRVHATGGDGWTNLAGHIIQGVPMGLRGQRVDFTNEIGGTVLSYPLSVFLPSEQERIRLQLKDVSIPPGLKAAHEFALRTIRRATLLHASGKLSDSGRQKAMDEAVLAFRKQAEPFHSTGKLSSERLDLIVQDMLGGSGDAQSP